MESCRVPPSRSRAKNEAEPSHFHPFPFFSFSILPRRQLLALPTALEPPVSKQDLMLLPKEEWIFDVRKNVSSRGASDFRRKGLFLAPARRCMRQGKGKVFDEIVCLGWTPNITNKLFHVILFSRRNAAMDLLTTLVFLRWGSRVFFWDQWRRLRFFIFRFLKYLRIILLNYLKMYIYIFFFLHMPLQFLGLLFIFRDISEISSKYERNTWAIWS